MRKARRRLSPIAGSLLALALGATGGLAAEEEPLRQLAEVSRLGQRQARAGRPVELAGIVLHADPDWGLLFVGDGEGAVFVDPTALGELPPVGARVVVQGTSAWLRDGVAVVAARLTVDTAGRLLPSSLPAAAELGGGWTAGAGPARWVAVEGVVRRVASEPSRGELSLQAGGRALVAWVPARPPLELLALVDGRVRLRGVLETRSGSGRAPRLFVPHWSELEVLEPPPPPEATPAITIREALAGAAHAARAEHRIRLRARVAERETPRVFVLEDDTGRLEAVLERPELVQQGSRLDLRGFLDLRGGRTRLVDASWRLISSAAAPERPPEPGLPLLESATAVRRLSRAEAERGHPVRLHGVVTYVDPADNHLFVQDESAGIYVHKGVGDIGVRPGDRVRVEGRSGPGNLAPVVLDPRITPLGSGPLPAARAVGAARFLTGRDDCLRVQLVGIVRAVDRRSSRLLMVLEADGLRLQARLANAPPELESESLVDASLRVEGVCSTEANWRGQLVSTTLFVARPQDMLPLEPPPAPLALPLTALSEVLRAGGETRFGHRVRISAGVLHQGLDQRLFLSDGRGSLSARLRRSLAVFPGDQVEVLGFPAPGPSGPVLEDAVARVLAHRPAPQPRPVEARQLGDHDGELVLVRARVQDLAAVEAGLLLVLQAGGSVFEALLESEDPVPTARPDSVLELVGVASLGTETAGGSGGHARLLLRSAADIQLIERPRFWTPRRASWALAALAGTVLAAFAWVLALRSQVRARTRELRERMENEERLEAQVRAQLEEMVEERTRQLAVLQKKLVHEERMAALGKLTTTVSHELRNPLATIRGSLFLLEETLESPPPRVKRALERAERSVRRSDEIIGELLDYARARRLERTATEVDPWLERGLADIALPPGVQLVRNLGCGLTLEVDAHRLLRCIINLVTNAAEAIVGPSPPGTQQGSRIEISTRRGGDRIEIVVLDDGPGVAAELQQQVFEPFFSTKSFGVGLGLSLVRQIAEQHGGGVELQSRPGATAFTLWLPLLAKPAPGIARGEP